MTLSLVMFIQDCKFYFLAEWINAQSLKDLDFLAKFKKNFNLFFFNEAWLLSC